MSKWAKIALVAYWLSAPAIVAGFAQIISGLPFTLTNGTVADATQVMADFNQIVNNTNANGAKNGVNSDITALTALVTPLTPAQGGSTLFIGGTSTGTANAQVVASPVPAGLALANKPTLYFNPGFTNTGATTLNANGSGATNIFKPSFSGPIALIGGEITLNQLTQVTYDGTRWVLTVDTPALGIATNLASAGTTDLGTIASHNVQITGTTGITSFGSTAQTDTPLYYIRFSGVVTLTHNGTSLILPGAANITTAANDTGVAQYLGSGNWQVIAFQRVFIGPVAPVPTTQRLTSTTPAQTYTAPAGVVRQRVRMVGPGGGGSGATANNGANSTANTSFQVNSTGTAWTALLGVGGTTGGAAGTGGTGGTNGSTGTLVIRMPGGVGGQFMANGTAGVQPVGGFGGSTPFGVGPNAIGGAPNPPPTNSGAGGGGAGSNSGTRSGSGGGGGEYVEFWVVGMTTATYTIGPGGLAGIAGTIAGAPGADGVIIVEEFYQ